VERFRRQLMLLAAVMLAFLVYASILSAFYGSSRASLFFTSIGMTIFWLILLASLVASFLVFSHLRRNPGSLMVHLACILIVAGAMYGSRPFHQFRQKYLGEKHVYDAYLVLHEGHSENRLLSEDESALAGELPFHVVLKRFAIDYYPSTHIGPAMPKQYRSLCVAISPEGKELAQFRVAVNEPATYAGYTFYQSSWGDDGIGRYSTLHVRAISGLYVVYAGYVILCLGLVWTLWIKNLLPVIRSYRGGSSRED
jgi:hypothetical protein